MAYSFFDHPYNTKFKKDPAVERWVYQRYVGQFGNFRLNAFNAKWITILYGIVPISLYFLNEKGVEWMDQFREEDINMVRLGR